MDLFTFNFKIIKKNENINIYQNLNKTKCML